AALSMTTATSPAAYAQQWQQHPMVAEVEDLMPRVSPTLDSALVSLWLRALERPEAGTRLEAAQAFAELALQAVPGVAEAVAPSLIARFPQEDEALVRRALARALVTMDARGAAPL